MIRPGLVIPMHYNTFPRESSRTAQGVKSPLMNWISCQVAVLAPGQSLDTLV